MGGTLMARVGLALRRAAFNAEGRRLGGLLCLAAMLGVGVRPVGAQQTRHADDPLLQISEGIAGCPVPAIPLETPAQARESAHWRAERGTSCYSSGRCRLPNAYLYDAEIIPRVRQFAQQDQRFSGTSLWVLGQRRWVFVLGCVGSEAQGRAIEQAIQGIDDVEAVIGQWRVGSEGAAPYPVAGPGP
ncbi:BON domain-containing protein [Curvibacter lanceolatus]|uniref:BON domain-containing protein n=1 Tax=Curvibacter lanceolatus TaxID=86182 RepID=UPI002354B776|nr:BON domain-containing protein [Curvibacter lanceolatus]